MSRSSSKSSKKSGNSDRTSLGSIESQKQKPGHYHDWPNTQGFDTHYEERSPIELETHGIIPAYAAGVLFRTGIGPRTVDSNGKQASKTCHWFDAFSSVHRFQIHQITSDTTRPRVTYNSRLTADGLIKRIQQTGKFEGFTFAKYDPCRSLFQKIQGVFESSPKFAPDEICNAVTMSVNFPGLSKAGLSAGSGLDNANIVTLCNKTDASRIQMIDPETLEPLGIANQSLLHPDLKGVASAAHAKSDPATGDVYNYNLDISGPQSVYRVFRASAATGQTTILATLKDTPAYLHSLFLTENYVLLCVWNSHFKAGGVSILWNQNYLDAMAFNSKVPARWYVIDKRCPVTKGGRGVIATYESDPCFCFHTINAYEEKNENGGTDILADFASYQNIDVISHFYLDNLLSDSPKASTLLNSPEFVEIRPNLVRHRLANIPSEPPSNVVKRADASHNRTSIDFTVPRNLSVELPTLNPRNVTKPYRYTYGVMFADGTKSTFIDALLKYDLDTHKSIKWEVQGHTPGEAIFVPDPNGLMEDDGVLLTVVLDGYKGTSYLVVLNAKDMTEMGRAEVPGAIGFGFHGTHSKNGLAVAQGQEEKREFGIHI